MSLLLNFVKNFISSNKPRITKLDIPKQLRVPGEVLYGMDSGSIFSLLASFSDSHEPSHLENEAALRAVLGYLNVAKNRSQGYHLLVKRVGTSQIFDLTDSEFDLLKTSRPQIIQGHQNKLSFVNMARTNNAFKFLVFNSILEKEHITHYQSETKLYRYLNTLLGASDFSKDDKITLDDMVLGNNQELAEILNDLKTKQRVTKSGQQIPLLHESVTVNELRDLIVNAVNLHHLRESLHPGKLVKTENGVLQDLGELSIQNYIVKQLNEKKQQQEAARQKQEEESQLKEINEDEMLIEFLDECRKANSLSEVSKTPIPNELKELGRVFHGLRDITIYAVMVKLIKLDKQNSKSASVAADYNIDAIYDVIEQHKLKLQNDLVHNLVIRIGSTEVFQITDQEFEALKQDERFLLLDTKEEFCQKVKANPKAIMDKLAQLIYRNEAEEALSTPSSNPLYTFAVRFLSDRKAASTDFNAVATVLDDLQKTQRTTKDGKLLPKLEATYITCHAFIEVLDSFIKEQKIENSIVTGRLTRFDKDELKDLGELTLQNSLVKKLNELKVVPSIALDDLCYTSLVNKQAAESQLTMSQADAAKALKKANDEISRI